MERAASNETVGARSRTSCTTSSADASASPERRTHEVRRTRASLEPPGWRTDESASQPLFLRRLSHNLLHFWQRPIDNTFHTVSCRRDLLPRFVLQTVTGIANHLDFPARPRRREA